jgi:uncharacterized membrane protein
VFHRFTGIANVLLAAAFVGVCLLIVQVIPMKSKARTGVRIGVVVVALAWLSVQANGGCS